MYAKRSRTSHGEEARDSFGAPSLFDETPFNQIGGAYMFAVSPGHAQMVEQRLQVIAEGDITNLMESTLTPLPGCPKDEVHLFAPAALEPCFLYALVPSITFYRAHEALGHGARS